MPTQRRHTPSQEQHTLHPDFPVVSGSYQLTPKWSLFLPGEFNRRTENDDLIIWRPGFTLWLAAWSNDARYTRHRQLRRLKETIGENAHELLEEEEPGLLRLRFRLDENADDGRVASHYSFAVAEDGYLQVAMYFDDEATSETADGIWRSISRGPAANA